MHASNGLGKQACPPELKHPCLSAHSSPSIHKTAKLKKRERCLHFTFHNFAFQTLHVEPFAIATATQYHRSGCGRSELLPRRLHIGRVALPSVLLPVQCTARVHAWSYSTCMKWRMVMFSCNIHVDRTTNNQRTSIRKESGRMVICIQTLACLV